METEFVVTLFLVFFILGKAVNLFLGALNQKEIARHSKPPTAFQDKIATASFERSKNYTLARLTFDKYAIVYLGITLLILLFSGILPWLDGWLRAWVPGPLHRGVLFLVLLTLLQGILKWPLDWYETFGIEGRYGFNTMSAGLFIKDTMKMYFLSILLGVPFVYLLLWLISRGGDWWLWVFGFVATFQLIMMVLYPRLLAPLFNKFKPLENGDLRQALMDLARSLNFPAQDIYVMDGSRRSLHSNAYFTGFGHFRRIVLFDTLISQMDVPELKSVLAHEIGHYKRKHIYKMLAFYFLSLGLVFYLLQLALDWMPLFTAFGFTQASPHVGLFLFATVFSAFIFFLEPLKNRFSRKHEYEADAFAVTALQSPEAMESALFKLSEKNLTNLTPHPWYSGFHYSHPTTLERVWAIRGVALPVKSQ